MYVKRLLLKGWNFSGSVMTCDRCQHAIPPEGAFRGGAQDFCVTLYQIVFSMMLVFLTFTVSRKVRAAEAEGDKQKKQEREGERAGQCERLREVL